MKPNSTTENLPESKVPARKDEIAEFFNKPENLNRLLPYFGGDQNKADKFKQTLLLLAMDPSRSQCSPISIFKAGLSCAEIGLSPQPAMKQAWFVPYLNKKKNTWDIQFQIGTLGWASLLNRSGKSARWYNVYTCDKFEYKIENGEDVVLLEPNWSERKEDSSKWVDEFLLGVLVIIENPELKTKLIKFVPKNKLDQIKMTNPAVRSGKYSPWTDWAAEMFSSKGLKYVLSKIPVDEKTALAIEVENKLEAINKHLLPKQEPSAIEADIAKAQGVIEAEATDVDEDFVESSDEENPFIDEEEK